MKERKTIFHRIILNNRLLILMSFITAIALWVFVSTQHSPEAERVVKDVPVTIKLEDSIPQKRGLEIFGTKQFTIDITVTGKRYVVNEKNLSANDFSAVAQLQYVDMPGKHILQIKVTPNNNSDFEITGYSESTIEVFFDIRSEKEFTLEADVEAENITPEGFVTGDYILSSNKVHISGPSSEVNKIKKVIARYTVEEELVQTKTELAQLIALNEVNGSLRYLTIQEEGEITITIPIYKTATLPLTVSFKNSPLSYINKKPTIECTPGTVQAGVPEKYLESNTELGIGTIDFCSLKAGENLFKIKTDELENMKILDNIKEITVKINIDGVETRTAQLAASDIQITNSPEGKTVSVSKVNFNEVILYGPAADLAAFDNAKITATCDLSRIELKSGKQNVNVSLQLQNNDNCWIYGKYNLTLELK